MGVRRVDPILARLRDRRAEKVIFVSHCLLNENTRYPGGACREGADAALVAALIGEGLGIVQMPCPEQEVWGGVSKRCLLATYGLDGRHPLLVAAKPLFALAFAAFSRFRFRGIARRVVALMEDYLREGYSVVGVLGVDGSPSCGVSSTMDLRRAFDFHAAIRPEGLAVDEYNRGLYASSLKPGRGIFMEEMARRMLGRRIDVRFRAQDLVRELREAGLCEGMETGKGEA